MSDSPRRVARIYEENVLSEEYPRSIGLFTIPEYPENEPQRGMWSAALEAILTTLRYLAPATLLTLFWGQQSFLFKLLKHIDSAFRAIVFSSEEQKVSVLQWLSDAGPVKVESLDVVWRHGWIICGVLDATLPGACAGHPPSTLPLKHAQAIADHYLGVEPVFSRQELESNDSLSKHQEWKLATYLDRIRQALAKITPPVSKPGSQRTSPDETQFTIDYVARGSGLSAAQVNNKMSFKVYPTAQQCLDPGEITILIKGPKDTYGMAVLPPVLGKAQLIRQKLLGLQRKRNYTENALPITQGARYLRSYGKNDMNKTYYIPKTKYDIEIEDELRADHLKISYIVPHEGRYEIYITSRGQNIVGSPFKVATSHNIINILEKDNFCLEDGDEIDIVDIKSDRKVVLRIVDFVTEKMLLRENGSLEKITDDEANILMTTDNNETRVHDIKLESRDVSNLNEFETKLPPSIEKRYKFIKIVKKIITANNVCKIWYGLLTEKQLTVTRKTNTNKNRPLKQKDIPDIVNSTFNNNEIKPFIITEKRDKFIIPENISVSILTEKCEPDFIENDTELTQSNIVLRGMNDDELCNQDSLEYYQPIIDEKIENNMNLSATPSSSNPFLNVTYEQHYKTGKDLGAFVASEYETNNSQNEETRDAAIKIIIDENHSMSPINNNPFINPNLINLHRPKSPVYKIISGEIKTRDVINEEFLGNEFTNPFFIHQHQSELKGPLPTADFIIGAPVSLPPIIRASSPVPEIESLIITNLENVKEDNLQNAVDDGSRPVFSTPLHTNLPNKESHRMDNNASANSVYHSLDSNIINNADGSNNPSNTDQTDTIATRQDITPKKEIWDSAYVSIDDNNSSDSNNNDNTPLCEAVNKQRCSPRDENYGLIHEDVINMGPAEREIWQTCSDLKENILTGHEDSKSSKLELKRRIFTPIIEENDRSLSSAVRDVAKSELTTKQVESDLVAVAFAELNDVYQEYFPNSENDSTIKALDTNHQGKVDTIDGSDKIRVDSASDIKADVKRHTNKSEGKISEVQANVTESNSVSQTLHKTYFQVLDDKNETQFGDKKQTNIVLERKKYWDEKIRQIEAKSAESTTHQKKRRLSSKYLRNNDSLTKRRGKQIVKNFLKAEESKENNTYLKSFNTTDSTIISQKLYKSHDTTESTRAEVKLVDKWKKYWDNKLEAENNETDALSCFRTKSPKHKLQSSPQPVKSNTEDAIHIEHESDSKSTTIPVKQEIPEEIYKAFETSPKRFFGTSRKQILSKIDTFLGNPSTVDKSSTDVIGASQDGSLVSSRISLFHKMSNTEDMSWTRRKCQSMQNIHHKKDSERSETSSDKALEVIKTRDPQKEILNPVEKLKEEINELNKIDIQAPRIPKILTLKERRAVMGQNTFNKSFDEKSISQELDDIRKETLYVKKTIKDFNTQSHHMQKYKNSNELRRTSLSKSEMDIFNKTLHTTSEDDFDKYRSCDELPKINVKNFISLYENVSKTNDHPVVKSSRISLGSQKQLQNISSPPGSVTSSNPPSISQNRSIRARSYTSSESFSVDGTDTKETNSIDIELRSTPVQDKETTYVSLSDIELEIVENNPDKPVDCSPVNDPDTVKKDYKSRFKMAKDFFQSLEELTDEKRPPKMNECQLLLQNKSTESLENDRPKRRVKKKIKAHSVPSSEIAKIWNQMQDAQESSNKLVKISEKFHVDDLFNDVMEGKLSRQGSLRGIPHKKAVLEAFRSMENISDRTISPYEIAVSQLSDFAKENQNKNAQTYLNEYPYLPKTDPSKYHSRFDARASGLISLKELLNKKPRRNSVPDLRLNASFTADL